QKHLLHRPRPRVQTLQSRARRILHLKTRRCLSATDFDPAGHDPAHVRASLDDVVEDLIEPAHSTMLAFDSAELHSADYTSLRRPHGDLPCPSRGNQLAV